MDSKFIAILQKIVVEQGRETLLNAAKCKAFLSNYTRGEYKKESRLLLLALDAGVQMAIDKAGNIAICKLQQIRQLEEEYSLAEERAAYIVDTLALVLRRDTNRTEIRKEKQEGSGGGKQQPAPQNAVSPKIGDIIPFGRYQWRVLDAQNGKALIITEDIIEKRGFNEKNTEVTWESCDLRGYLNGKFYNTFSEADKKRIVETANHNPDNLWYGTKGGKDTRDKVFLLSLEETDRYFGDSGDYLNKRRKKYDNGEWIEASGGWCFSNKYDRDRVAKYGSEACWWWLRSPGNYSLNAAIVYNVGTVDIDGYGITDNYGVLPALWLNL